MRLVKHLTFSLLISLSNLNVICTFSSVVYIHWMMIRKMFGCHLWGRALIDNNIKLRATVKLLR